MTCITEKYNCVYARSNSTTSKIKNKFVSDNFQNIEVLHTRRVLLPTQNGFATAPANQARAKQMRELDAALHQICVTSGWRPYCIWLVDLLHGEESYFSHNENGLLYTTQGFFCDKHESQTMNSMTHDWMHIMRPYSCTNRKRLLNSFSVFNSPKLRGVWEQAIRRHMKWSSRDMSYDRNSNKFCYNKHPLFID